VELLELFQFLASLLGKFWNHLKIGKALIRKVLDFIGYLQIKYETRSREERETALLATFGSWEDDREPEEIVQDIYASRTISELECEVYLD